MGCCLFVVYLSVRVFVDWCFAVGVFYFAIVTISAVNRALSPFSKNLINSLSTTRRRGWWSFCRWFFFLHPYLIYARAGCCVYCFLLCQKLLFCGTSVVIAVGKIKSKKMYFFCFCASSALAIRRCEFTCIYNFVDSTTLQQLFVTTIFM